MATSLTYPVPAPTGSEKLTAEQVHALLGNNAALAWRVRDLADQRFIADALLTGRYTSENGALLYETGEPIMIADDPEEIAAGGEYPQSQAYAGDVAAAQIRKWGREVPITDESIKRRKIAPVEKALRQLVNRMVKTVDSASLGVISSKVTQTHASASHWTSAGAVIDSIGAAKAKIEDLGEGFVLDTIVLTPTMYETVMGLFLKEGILPRESGNPALSGNWPEVLGLTWLKSAHVPAKVPLLVDTNNLGGMADEDLGSPDYSKTEMGIEVRSERLSNDSYGLRIRRLTVPVVVDAQAGIQITGVA